MNDAMDVVKIGEAFQHCQRDHSNHVNVDGSNLFVDSIQRAFVHKLHANADVRVGEICPPKGDNVLGMTVVHDLEFTKDLFAD